MRKIENDVHQSLFALLLLSLAIRPWRAAVSQDDATYAAQAIHFAAGHFQIHPDSTAFLMPQTVMGALAVKFLSFIGGPLVALNLLTWLLFCGLAVALRRKFKLGLSLWLSFLAVPFWIQYGASYLYDLWAVGILSLFLVFENRVEKDTKRELAVLGGMSFLLPLQLQVLAIFPALFGLRNGVMGRPRRAFAQGIGLAFGLFLYGVLDKSKSQQALPLWLLTHHQLYLDVIATFLQLSLGLGFFMLPWANFRKIGRKALLAVLVVQGVLLSLLVFSNLHILAAGVFFSDYLPRSISAFLATMGLWGWLGSLDLLKGQKISRLWPGIAGVSVIFAAYSWRGVADIRYCMIGLPLLLFYLDSSRLSNCRLGSSIGVALSGLVLSIVLNLYQLDTTEARWRAAEKIEAKGVSPQDISAGYGRDHFRLEWDCVDSGIRKLGGVDARNPAFLNEVYAYVPRYYERGWEPRYLVKPSRFLMKSLVLKSHHRREMDSLPLETIRYTSFGLSHELAIYENKNAKLSDCFR